MTTTGKKQTAANNELLATTKKAMNAKVYKEASRIMNADGEQATLDYLQSFFSIPVGTALVELATAVDNWRARRGY